MESPFPPTQRKHIPALDGLRGLAVGLVAFQHFFHGIAKGPTLADDIVFGLASRSWMGVDLFFVLSGFLITGILWDLKGRPNYLRNFYARRALRIFPAFYALLALIYVVLPALFSGAQQYVASSSSDQVWHWTYLSNFRIAWLGDWYQHHVPNVFWSLAIEEQFYLVWPLVVLACGRRTLVRVCLLLFLSAPGLRLVLAMDPDINWVTSFVLTPTRMDGLALGALLALLRRSDLDQQRLRSFAWLALLFASLPLLALTLQRPPNWRELPLQSLRFSFVAIFFSALVWLAVTDSKQGWIQRLFCSAPLTFLGKYSYALYLWHGPADFLARKLFHPGQTELIASSRLPAQALHLILASSLSIGAALLSWHILEKHFLRLKRPFES